MKMDPVLLEMSMGYLNLDACAYHPGPPYFHDAYKIWNCCNKKSTDFGTWLTYPGCTRGKHSAEKPVDIVKVAAVKEIRPEKVSLNNEKNFYSRLSGGFFYIFIIFNAILCRKTKLLFGKV